MRACPRSRFCPTASAATSRPLTGLRPNRRVGRPLGGRGRTELETQGTRRLSREQLLKLAAAAGAGGLVGGRLGRAQAALDWLGAESGRLQGVDLAGHRNDGGQKMVAEDVKGHPGRKPPVTQLTNQ